MHCHNIVFAYQNLCKTRIDDPRSVLHYLLGVERLHFEFCLVSIIAEENLFALWMILALISLQFHLIFRCKKGLDLVPIKNLCCFYSNALTLSTMKPSSYKSRWLFLLFFRRPSDVKMLIFRTLNRWDKWFSSYFFFIISLSLCRRARERWFVYICIAIYGLCILKSRTVTWGLGCVYRNIGLAISIMLLITWEKSYLFYCPSLHLAAPSVIPPPYSTPYMEPGNYVLLCLINSLTKAQLIKEEAPPDFN